MKRLLAFVSLVCLLTTTYSYAASATWALNPISGDWNTPVNWAPPNVPTDTAEFGVSNLPEISFSFQGGFTVSELVFDPSATNYTFTLVPGQTLIVQGDGIINTSAVTQTFHMVADESGTAGGLSLQSGFNPESAGSNTVFTNDGGLTIGGNGAFTEIAYRADAGSALIINNGGQVEGAKGGEVEFFGGGSANTATITNRGGAVSGALGGLCHLSETSSADHAVITCEGATIGGAAGGSTVFVNTSNAANSTLIAQLGTNGGTGGSIQFDDGSKGSNARVEVFGNGSLNISAHNAVAVTIGSLEGDGQVFLGARKLSIGTSNLSTTFSGVIQDTGSLTKLGNGTLTFSGTNTYTGTTTVSAGALRVSNRTGSATGTGAVNISSGTLGGGGIVAGAVTVGSESGTGAFLAPGVGASQPTGLTLQSAVTLKGDSTYTYKLNTNKTKADQVLANGVTIETGAQFDFSAVANKKVATGTVFTAISNTSATPISGTFANLADGSTFTAGRNNFQVSYSGGDGNDLTLTVVP